MKKRILCLLLGLCLAASFLPMGVLASEKVQEPASPEAAETPALAEAEILPLLPVGIETQPEPAPEIESAPEEAAEETSEETTRQPESAPSEAAKETEVIPEADGLAAYYYNGGLDLRSVTADRSYTDKQGSSAKAVWDADTLTLTLSGGTTAKPMTIGGTIHLPEGAAIKVSGAVTVSGDGLRGAGALALDLASGCSLTVTSATNAAIEAGSLTITGNGSLTVQGTWSGIEAENTLDIRGGSITSRCTSGYGLSALTVKLSGGTVNTYGGTNTSVGNRDGLNASYIEISGGQLNAYGRNGIQSYKGMTVSGGTVYAEGDTWYGIEIYYDAALTISGGKVTAVGSDVAGLHLFAYNGKTASLNVVPPSGRQVVLSAGDSASSAVSFPHESSYSTTEMDYVWFRSEGQALKNNNKGYYNSGLDLRNVSYGGYYTDKNGGDCRVTYDPVEKTVSFAGGTESYPLAMNSSAGVGLILPADLTLVVDGVVSISGTTYGIRCPFTAGFDLSFGSGDKISLSGATAVESGEIHISGAGTLAVTGTDCGLSIPKTYTNSYTVPGDLEIRDGAAVTVTVTPAEGNSASGISMGGHYADLRVSGASLSVTNNGSGRGIYLSDSLNGGLYVTDGDLTVRCSQGSAISNYGPSTFTDAQVDLSGKSGIYSSRTITVTRGELSVSAGSGTAVEAGDAITFTDAQVNASSTGGRAFMGDNEDDHLIRGSTVNLRGVTGANGMFDSTLTIEDSDVTIQSTNGWGISFYQIEVVDSSLRVSAAGTAESGAGFNAIVAHGSSNASGFAPLSVRGGLLIAQSEKGLAIKAAAEKVLAAPGGGTDDPSLCRRQ